MAWYRAGVCTDAAIQVDLRTIIDAALRGALTGDQAARAVALDPEAASAVMLAASACIAEQIRRIAELSGKTAPGPHTPSRAIPPHTKGNRGSRRRKKPGARNGHEGHRRPTPEPDQRVEVALASSLSRNSPLCPRCGAASAV